MAKARNARRKASIGPVEKLDGPTPEQIAKGGYVREDFSPITARGVWPSTAETDWCGDGLPFDDE